MIKILDTPQSRLGIEGYPEQDRKERAVLGTIMDDVNEFRAPQTMTPGELGDSLARLVWESFSDFVSREDVETPLPDEDTISDDIGSAHRTAEEALIFFMWAHTRGAQLSVAPRTKGYVKASTRYTRRCSRTWWSTVRPSGSCRSSSSA